MCSIWPVAHDNGLVFGSRAYRALVRDYGLAQEYIAPYTPEQIWQCERFIRTFKEECAWQHRFDGLAAARSTVARYIEHDNTQRHIYLALCNPPHQQAPDQHWLSSNFEGSTTMHRSPRAFKMQRIGLSSGLCDLDKSLNHFRLFSILPTRLKGNLSLPSDRIRSCPSKPSLVY